MRRPLEALGAALVPLVADPAGVRRPAYVLRNVLYKVPDVQIKLKSHG